ncbi:hypothetical protein F4604DRAFT_1690330 [Suillus subluteus]|nr:hypothetical protein F4604DRAFT_1690330 [Suillus subluteus]
MPDHPAGSWLCAKGAVRASKEPATEKLEQWLTNRVVHKRCFARVSQLPMVKTSNPEPPRGAGGKSTEAFNSAGSCILSDVPKPFPCNKILKAFSFLNTLTPNTMKRVVGAFTGVDTSPADITVTTATSSTSAEALVFKDSDTIITKTMDTGTEILRLILNLMKAKIHVPLTLLTLTSLWKTHLDPSCVKMKKGFVLNNPKKSIMDTSTFPVEASLPVDRNYICKPECSVQSCTVHKLYSLVPTSQFVTILTDHPVNNNYL